MCNRIVPSNYGNKRLGAIAIRSEVVLCTIVMRLVNKAPDM